MTFVNGSSTSLALLLPCKPGQLQLRFLTYLISRLHMDGQEYLSWSSNHALTFCLPDTPAH